MGLFAQEGCTIRRTKRLFNKIAADVFGNMSEAAIKKLLYELLQCYDIPPEMKQEAIKLLQLSETAFTTEQRQRLLLSLME